MHYDQARCLEQYCFCERHENHQFGRDTEEYNRRQQSDGRPEEISQRVVLQLHQFGSDLQR